MSETMIVVIGAGAEAAVLLEMESWQAVCDTLVFLDAVEGGPTHCHDSIGRNLSSRVVFGGKAFSWSWYGKPTDGTGEAGHLTPNVKYVRGVGDQGTWAKWVHWFVKWFGKLPPLYSPCGWGIRAYPSAHWWENGVTVHDGVHIGPRAFVGFGSLINTNAIIEHDVKIGSGVFVGPGAIILGGAEIGEWSFIGAGAIIAPNTKIHPHTFVKMGTRVTPASHPRSKRLVVDTDPAVADNVARPVEGGNDGR